MLTLGRKLRKRIVTTVPPSDKPTVIVIEFAELRGTREDPCARLAFTAPEDVVIDREEIHERKIAERFASAVEGQLRKGA